MSAPPVRIESMAWTDHRYTMLALVLGMVDRDFALIKVATIWRWQTEHYSDDEPTYTVPRAVVAGALNSLRGPDAMIEAGLAEPVEGDPIRIRIRGGRDAKGKSRIDWLFRERQAQAERGRRRAERAKDEGRANGQFTSAPPAGHQPEGVQSPAADQRATSSPISGLRSPITDPDLPLRDVRVGMDATAHRLHAEHARQLAELAKRVPGARAPMAGGLPQPKTLRAIGHLLVTWLAPAAAAGLELDAFAMARMAELVEVRTAAAIGAGHVKWWASDTFWDPGHVERDLLQTGAAIADAPPRERAPPRVDRSTRPHTAGDEAGRLLREIAAEEAAGRTP